MPKRKCNSFSDYPSKRHHGDDENSTPSTTGESDWEEPPDLDDKAGFTLPGSVSVIA